MERKEPPNPFVIFVTIRAIRGKKVLLREAAEVARCLREGLRESSVMTLEESVSVMETLDEIRRQIGLTYPV